MGRRTQIGKPIANTGKRINIPEDKGNYDAKPPIFSLERLQGGYYCFSQLSEEEKAHFAEAIFKRRSLTWSQIRTISRHALGTEKIPKSSINTTIPSFITDDNEDFIVFRFSGLKPMVGYRLKDIFYVLWFDHDFSLYDHG